jgi:hypothetical protein
MEGGSALVAVPSRPLAGPQLPLLDPLQGCGVPWPIRRNAKLHHQAQRNGGQLRSSRCTPTVTEPTNYTKLSKKIIHQADNLANLSPYNPIVREITTDFKPTYALAKIVISLAVTITNYIKVHIANTSEFKHSYYKPSSNKNSESI